MANETKLVKISYKAGNIAQDANAAYWVSENYTRDYLKNQIDENFLELAEILGYKVVKN